MEKLVLLKRTGSAALSATLLSRHCPAVLLTPAAAPTTSFKAHPSMPRSSRPERFVPKYLPLCNMQCTCPVSWGPAWCSSPFTPPCCSHPATHQQLLPLRQYAEGVDQVSVSAEEVVSHCICFDECHQCAHVPDLDQQCMYLQQLGVQLLCR